MSDRIGSIFSPRRVLAEALAWVDYRRFQNLYWTLRSSDLRRRYRHENDFPVIADIIRTTRSQSLLDIGCGFGRLFDLYVRLGVREVIGLELSDSLLGAARQRAEELEAKGETRFTVKKHDLREPLLDLPAVDLVVSSRVLQHIHPEDIRASVKSLARPGVKSVYLNERLTSSGTASYIFVHDYTKLFSAFGFRERSRGKVPVLDYDYLILER